MNRNEVKKDRRACAMGRRQERRAERDSLARSERGVWGARRSTSIGQSGERSGVSPRSERGSKGVRRSTPLLNEDAKYP